MLKDTELDTLSRAVAALGDEDASRLDEAVRERRKAKAAGPGVMMVETTTSADGTVRLRTAEVRGDEGFAILMQNVCATWDEIQRRVPDALEAARNEATATAFDAAVSACIGASYGPPSGWGADRPRGWHLPEPCSPRDASMHDNGCMDAARRIRLRQNADADRREAHAAARAVIRKRKDAVGRDADLPATGSFHA